MVQVYGLKLLRGFCGSKTYSYLMFYVIHVYLSRCRVDGIVTRVWARQRKNRDDWLTVHRSITLVDLQLDAQNSYLFTYNTFIKIIYMFRALPCSSSGGLRRNCILAASGIVTVCRRLSCVPVKKEVEFFLNRCTRQSPAESDDTRGCIYTVTT